MTKSTAGNLENDLKFIQTFRSDISTVWHEIPDVIESLETIREEITSTSEALEEEYLKGEDSAYGLFERALDGEEIKTYDIRRELADSDQLEQLIDTIRQDLQSEISHLQEFIEELNSLEQAAIQSEEIIEESKKAVQ